MRNQDIMMVRAASDEVEINQNELAQRLGTARGYNDDLIESCKKRLMEIIDYKCAYIRIRLDVPRENVCAFDFMTVESRQLYNNLKGCKEVFAMALTAGINVDRELAKLRIVSQAEYFVTDALASAAVDSFADYASAKMRGVLKTAPRFSPGYGDFSLSFQKPFLERLDAHGLLGITLDNAYLMTPMKSITAIMGIRT